MVTSALGPGADIFPRRQGVYDVHSAAWYCFRHSKPRDPIGKGQMTIFGRRDFVFALAVTAAAWPLAAQAQQPAMPVIGLLINASPGPYAPMMAAFRQGLGEAGYVDGKNVAIEYRWAEDQVDRLPALATDLVRHQAAVIAAAGPPAAQAAKAATTTVPIVFLVGTDPVKSGLVTSLNRPEGNLTGIGFLINTLAPKLLEVLHELVPKAITVGMLLNAQKPRSPTSPE